jgi:hypothetical protein
LVFGVVLVATGDGAGSDPGASTEDVAGASIVAASTGAVRGLTIDEGLPPASM